MHHQKEKRGVRVDEETKSRRFKIRIRKGPWCKFLRDNKMKRGKNVGDQKRGGELMEGAQTSST